MKGRKIPVFVCGQKDRFVCCQWCLNSTATVSCSELKIISNYWHPPHYIYCLKPTPWPTSTPHFLPRWVLQELDWLTAKFCLQNCLHRCKQASNIELFANECLRHPHLKNWQPSPFSPSRNILETRRHKNTLSELCFVIIIFVCINIFRVQALTYFFPKTI